jgi:hypothetical protein
VIAITKSLFFVNQFSAMVVWHHKQDAAHCTEVARLSLVIGSIQSLAFSYLSSQ